MCLLKLYSRVNPEGTLQLLNYFSLAHHLYMITRVFLMSLEIPTTNQGNYQVTLKRSHINMGATTLTLPVVVMASELDGVHPDVAEHQKLGKMVLKKVLEII